MGGIVIFIILIPPIQVHDISLHQGLIVFCIQIFVSLERFIPGYFILLDGVVNGIVSLISPSDLSLISCRLLRRMRLETLPSSLLE